MFTTKTPVIDLSQNIEDVYRSSLVLFESCQTRDGMEQSEYDSLQQVAMAMRQLKQQLHELLGE